MRDFRVLRPEEVEARWPELSKLLEPAVASGSGELVVDDILRLVQAGSMFVVADDSFALTLEFLRYPRKTVLLVGFGGGVVKNLDAKMVLLKRIAKSFGADSIQAYCSNPAMVRYCNKHLGVSQKYSVLEAEV